jgi:putative hydrolase of the HAD superfamily
VRVSGISEYFQSIEIVSEKSDSVYSKILEKNLIKPENFIMVGNSLRSDILPVIKIGSKAVHIPYPDTWEFENIIPHPSDADGYYEINTIEQLPSLIEQLELV